jgi:hypothetical protein
LRLPNTETAGKSRSTESAKRLGDISRHCLVARPTSTISVSDVLTWKGSVTCQPSRAVADVR